MILSLARLWAQITGHPLAQGAVPARVSRAIRWQIATRAFDRAVVVPFVEPARLVVSRGMHGATGNVYNGLAEFDDMSFLLHFLQADDVFCDVGANVGAYTVLASRVRGCRSVCVEPVAASLSALRDNIGINAIHGLVDVRPVAVGDKDGSVWFTDDQDTTNHVVGEATTSAGSIEVPIRRLDALFADDGAPTLIKMDVEGYELPALKGASRLLGDPRCQAIVIEINGSGQRYGISDSSIDALIRSFGFQPVSYAPFSRALSPIQSFGRHNTIYVKDIDAARRRVAAAPAFRIDGRAV